MRGGLLYNRKHVPERTATRQPCFIFTSATRSRDAEAIFSEHDHGNVQLIRSTSLLADRRRAVRECGQRVCIENYFWSSGSIFSNSASITRSIRQFSL